jgi:hypothetical protein
MNCRHYRKTLIEIARNQTVAETLRNQAEDHAKQCASCARAFKDEKTLTSLLREAAKSQATLSLPIVPEALIKTFRSHDRDSIRPAKTPALILARVAVLLIFLTAGIVMYRRVSDNLIDQQAKSQISGQLATAAAARKPYIATEFIPITEGETAWETMQMVRVRLPRSALLEVGLPMNETYSEESILADVLISDEGLPYAIRFIKE